MRWAVQVGHRLGSISTDDVDEQWIRWFQTYWEGRLTSLPRRMHTEEASAMARWVVHLAHFVTDGVSLVMRHPAGFEQNTSILSDLTEERIARAPNEFARMIVHLLSGTEPPFYDGYNLPDIVDRLKSLGVSELVIEQISEGAIRLDIDLTQP